MERHQRSFFGQKVGIIYDSGSWDDESIYLTFLKQLDDKTWEKPSRQMGKKIKLNLGEQIMIAKVLSGELKDWSTVHKFKEQNTSISVNRDEKENVWIKVDAYRKRITSPELEILLMMIEHVIHEKIVHSTGIEPRIESSSQADTTAHGLSVVTAFK